MWAGSTDNSGSLNYFDRETGIFKHFLNDLKVNVIFEDSDSILWIGTWQGLYKSKNKIATMGFKEFGDSSGMIQNSEIYGIQEDDQKNLWLSSSAGILKINLKSNEFTLFDAINGVDGNLMENCGSYKAGNGELYFGNQKGFYSFRPNDIRLNPQKPQILFSDLRIGGKSVSASDGSILIAPIELTHEITLKYTQNSFDIDFAGINYANPEYNRHLYILENYDTAWRVPQNEKTASYSNMPPGEYTLHVKAATSGGEWVENELKIKIIPPFWKRWWAYSFYFLCILAGIFFTDRIRRKVVVERERAKTREREIEQAREIEKAYKQLEKAHENLKSTQSQLIQAEKMASLGELTAGIAHEIQNPLNFVNNFSEVNNELIDEIYDEIKKGNMKEAQEIIKDVKDNNTKITHHGKRADTIVKGMLQHSRTSSGTKESADINALANEYLRLSYHGIRAKAKDFNADIITDFDNSIGKVNVIPQDIGRVLLNLYNNAFYAVGEKNKIAETGYEPSVTVTTKKYGDKIEIRVRDNGNGIPKKVVDKIFQPFFTTKPTGQGTGLGLSLSYDIVKAHGGDIKVDTKEGEYAEFLVNLPIS